MFTGIIEETGIVKKINLTSSGGSLLISAHKVLVDTKIGDSIAVNGICLTVTSMEQDGFTADVMNETLKHTSLKELKKGSVVNLERALSLNQRLGGHIVSGHIDGTGTITAMVNNGIAILFTMIADKELTDNIIKKGSIAIDGISLTVVSVNQQEFTVSLIPHTVSETNLKEKKVGSIVNLETDIIGKYIKKFLFSKEEKEENLMTLLAENGFL